MQIGTLLEKLIFNHIISPVNNILDNRPHGFRPGWSTLTCNISLQHFILDYFKENCQVDIIYTHFEKAFDQINHKLLITELGRLEFGDPLLTWLNSYLTNRSQFTKILDFQSNTGGLVPSGTPQGGNLSPILFLLFINDNYILMIFPQFLKMSLLIICNDLKIFVCISSINDLILQIN